MNIADITSEVLRKSPSGTSCIFVKLDAKRGLKLYRGRREAVECRWRQRKAAKCGLAPKVFGKTELIVDYKKYYGYVSQVADVVPYIDGYLCLPNAAARIIEESSEFGNLFCGLREIGLGGDLAVRNIGWIEGRMVGIDFSHHSVW